MAWHEASEDVQRGLAGEDERLVMLAKHNDGDCSEHLPDGLWQDHCGHIIQAIAVRRIVDGVVDIPGLVQKVREHEVHHEPDSGDEQGDHAEFHVLRTDMHGIGVGISGRTQYGAGGDENDGDDADHPDSQ